MTEPKLLQLVPLDVQLEQGMVLSSEDERPAENYKFGMDVRGTVYLIYRHPRPSIQSNQPRLSAKDPHWSVNHGLRYIEWVTP